MNIRSGVNQLFGGADSFTVACVTAASIVAASGAIAGARAIADGSAQRWLVRLAVRAAASTPGGVGDAVERQRREAAELVAAEILRPDPSGVRTFERLPEHGLPHDEVLRQMQLLAARDDAMNSDMHFSGCIYWGNSEHSKLLARAQELFLLTNPLHPDAFPAIGKFEREIVKMTKCMLGAQPDDQVCGVVTSGGTESILMALKAYREQGRARGITRPELIVPVTAHAAFDKGAQYFGLHIVKIGVNARSQAVDVDAVRRAISSRTVAIVGSAPQYPHGTVDPIEQLGELALRAGVGLHVDGCLGGFLLPWLARIGVDLGTKFDFSVRGVTSISADTHKYGYTTKGTSVLLFRTPELKRHMYFMLATWPGGLYASPSMAGSRPGALIAGAWASLVALGNDGFERLARGIATTFAALCAATRDGRCGPLSIVGEPRAMVIAWTSDKFDIQRWASGMKERGWHLNRLQSPNAVHICLTAATIGIEERFISDSKALCDALLADKALYASGQAAVYGMAAAMPDSVKDVVVSEIATTFLDTMTGNQLTRTKSQ